MEDEDLFLNVIYKDNYFVKLGSDDKDWKNFKKVVMLTEMPANVELGDKVIRDYDNKPLKYKIVEKQKNPQPNYSYNDVCVIKKLGKNFMSILKNGCKKIEKTNVVSGAKPNEVGVILNNTFKKDDTIFKYLLKPFKDAKSFKIKSYFSIKKYIVGYCYEDAVCMYNIENFSDIIYVPVLKLNANFNLGDLYFYLQIDNKEYFYFDEENANDLATYYVRLLHECYSVDENLSMQEQLYEYSKILSLQEYILDELKKVNEKLKKDKTLNVKMYDKEQVVAVYELEEQEQYDGGIVFRASLEESFDEKFNDSVLLFDYNLPKGARVGDIVECVKDDNENLSYYFTHKLFKNNLVEEIENTKNIIKDGEASL